MHNDFDSAPVEIDGQWTFPDGVTLPVIAGGEGDETPAAGDAPAAPADGADAAAEATPDAPAGDAPASTETTPATGDTPAAGDAPTGDAALADALLTELVPGDLTEVEGSTIETTVAAIDQEIADAQANPANVTMVDITRFRALRQVQQTLAGETQRRLDAATEVSDGLAEIAANVVTLPTTATTPATPAEPAPEAIAASAGAPPAAAPVDTGAHRAAIQSIRDRAQNPQDAASAESTASRVASPGVLARTVAWQSLRAADPGEADFGRLLNGTRPVKIGDQIQTRDESILAAAVIEADPEMQLTDSRSHNEHAMALAIGAHRISRSELAEARGSRTAAVCTPSQIIREAMVCGTDAVPLQGALVQMNAISGNNNNLAYSYRLPTSINEAAPGVGVWDSTNQAAISRTDPNTWKPCIAIACPGYADETAKEFTACFTVDAFTELSSPEQVADFEQAKDRAFARFTESWFLRKLDTYLFHVSHTATMGTVPDVINAVLTSLANGHFAERMNLEAGYVVFGSPGLLYAATIDENSKAYRSGPSTSLDDVMGIVNAATGTDYVQLYDLPLRGDGTLAPNPFGSLGTVGAGGATPLPTIGGGVFTYTLRVIDPSAFIGFNTGEATFGQQITFDQARRNERGFFQRVFGGLMKPGCAPGYRIDITVFHDGSRGGFVTPGLGSGHGS